MIKKQAPTPSLNFFKLFQDATVKFLNSHHGVPICGNLENLLNVEFNILQKLYYDEAQIDYTSVGRMASYSMHFAPRHAVIWRQWLRSVDKSSLFNAERLNSIGTGPGSELIGIAAASKLPPGSSIEVMCLERNEGWRELLDIVITDFNSQSPVKIKHTFTDKVERLFVGAPVIGSCVLSEFGRDKKIVSFLEQIANVVGNVRGRFLDFPQYPVDGKTPFIEDVINRYAPTCEIHKLKEETWGMQAAVADEQGSCTPLLISYRVSKPPGLRMHLFRFK